MTRVDVVIISACILAAAVLSVVGPPLFMVILLCVGLGTALMAGIRILKERREE